MNRSIFMEDEKHISVHWECAADFLEYVNDPSERRANHQETEMSGQAWFGPGNNNYKDVIHKSVYGDALLLENLNVKISQINRSVEETKEVFNTVKVQKRKAKHGKFGDELDIHKVYRGDLDTAWRRTERHVYDHELNLIILVIDVSHLCDVDCRDTLWGAAVAVKILDDLLKAGKSVKVIVQWTANNMFYSNRKPMTNSIVVKEYGQNLSIERLATMSHAGFLRSWGFVSANAQHKYVTAHHLGQACSNEGHIPAHFKEDVKGGKMKMVFIPRALNIHQAISSIKNVQQKLKKENQ